MDANNISDVIFSLNDNSYRNQEANFKFIYNNYSTEETDINDKSILNRTFSEVNSKKNRFIRIGLENLIFNLDNRDNNRENSAFLQEILNPLFNKDITDNTTELFNKLDGLMPNRKSLLIDVKKDEFENYAKLLSSKESDMSSISFSNNDRSSKISIKNQEEYISKFKNKEFVENFNYNNLSNYEKIVTSELVENARSQKEGFHNRFKSGDIFSGLNMVSKTINTGDIKSYADLNGQHCGIYIEKFLIKDQNINFLCSKFFSSLTKFSNVKIEDEAVNYGKVYRYAIYNTYVFTCVDPDNRFMLNHYLVCTHPYISNDIECIENKMPPEPIGLNAFYDKNKKSLFLEWDEPTNYENDIRGYQILRRENINSPFTLVKQIEGHLRSDFYNLEENVNLNSIIRTPGKVNKFYHDESFNENKLMIYTIRSIDAHGMVSNCGVQTAVYYDFMRNKTICNVISDSGCDVNYPNMNLVKNSMFVGEESEIIDNLPIVNNPSKISLYIAPDFGYITADNNEKKVLDKKYQFTFSNLNNAMFRSDIFTIDNFG